MLYKSTRSQAAATHSAAQIIKQGLAEDGGLFVPQEIPTLTMAEIEALCQESYPVRAAKILAKFLNKINGLCDHKMGIDHHIRILSKGLKNGKSHGNIGHKNAVHNVKMDIIGIFNGICFLSQLCEIRSKYGGCYFNHINYLPKIFLSFVLHPALTKVDPAA